MLLEKIVHSRQQLVFHFTRVIPLPSQIRLNHGSQLIKELHSLSRVCDPGCSSYDSGLEIITTRAEELQISSVRHIEEDILHT